VALEEKPNVFGIADHDESIRNAILDLMKTAGFSAAAFASV